MPPKPRPGDGNTQAICKAVDGIALLHAAHKLITAWGLGLETVDNLPPYLFRRERLLILIPRLPLGHFRCRTTETSSNGEWGSF